MDVLLSIAIFDEALGFLALEIKLKTLKQSLKSYNLQSPNLYDIRSFDFRGGLST